MDRISGLSDELLIKILLFVSTKVAISTSILSKRWEYLWMWLPKLEYGQIHYSPSECRKLRYFLDKNLPLHRAPVIGSFHLVCKSLFKPENIKLWVVIAVSHCLRELEVIYSSYPEKPNILLVYLQIPRGLILLDVPRMAFLPSLKTLYLRCVKYFNDESLQRLLSNCPVLEDLSVNPIFAEFITLYTSHYCLVENMPNLIEADVDVQLPNIKNLIGAITSVKSLAICSEAMYDEGFVFNQLKHLKLCRCKKHSSDLLVGLLKDSSNLQALDLFEMVDHDKNDMVYWNQPSTVPECILLSLQTLNCSGYAGTPEERDLAVYILKNAVHLKTTTISSVEVEVPKFEMIKELALSPRASTTCQLVFH